MTEKNESGPSRENGETAQEMPKIKLKVLNRETHESRYCEIEETKEWDWSNPEMWRVINGWQITSYGMLLFMLRQKEERGLTEVVLQEIPAFMMLNGC